ncbi:hypothetical protein GXP67_01810 [Rhodocytophaga rosea]|uniref:Uncharacterized protein n=1 Tax=Rhodocytophaga rosea TaxID=2704465 RepID=A0A6C0GCB4_9BACT|nr:hypothetical protein [Rhodocytophaga rosea]QHT65494.1 hypothetical protein GXP67_01810 [Rhodocytophaga rosea]
MEEQIKFYQQIIDAQLSLRNSLQIDHFTSPHIMNTVPLLLDAIDEQVRLLNQIIAELKAQCI